MAYHNSGGDGERSIQLGLGIEEYSGDERDSRSGGEDRHEFDLLNKPIYLLEHLATFTVNKESGIVYPADGMRRLLQLEKTTGIWSQKMELCLDHQWVLIMDYETRTIIERFPATLIHEPTAFTSMDAMELYNNILVFIVSGDNESRSEMHIFQSQSVSAVHLVEDLKNLRSGKINLQQRELHGIRKRSLGVITSTKVSSMLPNRAEQFQNSSQTQSHHSQLQSQLRINNRATTDHYGLRSDPNALNAISAVGSNGDADSEQGGLNDETSSTSSDKYEKDVTVLNHCFDDIEKFIARLQHAAAASRELERRRRNRKSKKKDPGEGLLTLRTRPPNEKEFIDIFAKFKLSFNLLAKLKAHIHDPNAPELVHFLFTPLALIVEASSDTYYESQLPTNVVNPLLTREAINLLINCVTSKETELWRSLGDAWTVPRDQWKDDVGSYHPVFLDGWSPGYLVVDELHPYSSSTRVGKRRLETAMIHHDVENSGGVACHGGYDDYDSGANAFNDKYTISQAGGGDRGPINTTGMQEFSAGSEISVESMERGSGATGTMTESSNVAVVQGITAGIQSLHTREHKQNPSSVLGTGDNTGEENMLQHWIDELQISGAKIVLVTYPRTANNDKELSVVRGEYLEILDDTRKWWKARNIRGQVAHVPHTIVTPYNYGDVDPTGGKYYEQHFNYKSSSDTTDQRVEESTNWARNQHVGKKGEFRYF